jgi:hypothetical protein
MDHVKVEVDGWLNIGRCFYDEDSNVIAIKMPNRDYYMVCLNSCQTGTDCLKEIFYISTRPWGREVMSDFVELLYTTLPNDSWFR